MDRVELRDASRVLGGDDLGSVSDARVLGVRVREFHFAEAGLFVGDGFILFSSLMWVEWLLDDVQRTEGRGLAKEICV